MKTSPRWATRKEAAAYARTSPSTIDRWLDAGHITRYGADRHIRIDLNEIDAFLMTNTPTRKAS